MTYSKEYLRIVNNILNNEEFKKRKKYHHHENESVYDHCLEVSHYSYLYAKKHNLDYESIAIGGLLHDFYYKDWQLNHTHKSFFKMHGFVHAKEALDNSKKVFPKLMNPIVEDIIVKHMFPLNIKLPKYKESWVVSFMDKKCSLKVFKHPTKLLKYLGIRGKRK